MNTFPAWTVRLGLAAACCTGGYIGLVTGAVPVDLGVGRRQRPLGPFGIDIAAPRDVVFDVLAEPYLGRQSKAMRDKIRVLHRGDDMVLAAHRTHVRGRLVATTVETVRFVRPDHVEFHLVRGPVPHVVEEFRLSDLPSRTGRSVGTRLAYHGEIGSDLWQLGTWWADRVAVAWERAVRETFAAVQAEAQRRHVTSAPPR